MAHGFLHDCFVRKIFGNKGWGLGAGGTEYAERIFRIW
jgi:hypothetical protein